MKKILYSVLVSCVIIILSAGDIIAQGLTLSGEFRPRFEFRNGYKKLIADDQDPAAFVSQRTRLNLFYNNEKFKVGLSVQDVRVWGDVSQLNKTDAYGPSIHEAWGEILVCSKFSIKLGRQEIAYDDQRIFGSVGWTQQARSHDALVLKFNPGENHKIDIGLAYNANDETLFKTPYLTKNYKTLQYIWYHGAFNKIGLSVFFLNNGLAYDNDPDTAKYNEKVAFSQTIGPRFSYAGGKVKFNIAFYYQGGKNGKNKTLAATYFAADVLFIPFESFSVGLGGEYLSGTASKDQINPDENDKSFTPFYGTNHKFNGWMDYFYVGNHGGNVGLIDIYLPVKFSKNRFSIMFIPHYLMSAATVSTLVEPDRSEEWKDYSNGLGIELDLAIGYAITKSLNLNAGYSQMFGTETMQALKGGNYQNVNNWAWVMVTFKPTFMKN